VNRVRPDVGGELDTDSKNSSILIILQEPATVDHKSATSHLHETDRNRVD